MAGWLAALDHAALARVLVNRPDALRAPQPRSVTELADRLGRPESLAAALRSVPAPCVQLVEAAMALGGTVPVNDLTAFLEHPVPDAGVAAQAGPGHTENVLRWLSVLADHGVAWIGTGGEVHTAEALDAVFPSPLGLGPPLNTLFGSVSVDGLRRILRTLGVAKPPARRVDVVTELMRVLADPDAVRAIVSTAPPTVAEELAAWARGNEPLDDEDLADDDDNYYYDDDARAIVSYLDPVAHQRRATAAEWALGRGLVFPRQWSYGWQMPAEISRAIRGEAFRAPFTPFPPRIAVTAVKPSVLASHASASVSRFAELALALVDGLARTGLSALKSGGVGARELGRLAKSLGCEDGELRLALELCAAVGLVGNSGGQWRLSVEAERWRSMPPADRVSALLASWWQLPFTACESRDADGKTVPALKARACRSCAGARSILLKSFADVDGAADLSEVAGLALWGRPFVHVLAQDANDPFATIFAEATTLGVIAVGALTPLGRALIANDSAALRELLADALPKPNDRALFGADLTVVVTGAPTAEVSRLLDAAADRESRGGATVWRFTPGSIRRGLDEGHDPTGLEAALADIATGALPQALRYLIADIGRRHGSLRVSPAVSVVRSDDETLLQQAVADKALRKLGLRLLAPTVLAADADADAVLAQLRDAGYLPMPDDGRLCRDATDGPATADVGRVASLDAWRQRKAPAPTRDAQPPVQADADPAELAALLLAHPTGPATTSKTEALLAGRCRSLSATEIRMLAHALDQRGSVDIDYRAQSGSRTRRTISRPELTGDTILAWCGLRQDERWFRLNRIQAVLPSGLLVD